MLIITIFFFIAGKRLVRPIAMTDDFIQAIPKTKVQLFQESISNLNTFNKELSPLKKILQQQPKQGFTQIADDFDAITVLEESTINLDDVGNVISTVVKTGKKLSSPSTSLKNVNIINSNSQTISSNSGAGGFSGNNGAGNLFNNLAYEKKIIELTNILPKTPSPSFFQRISNRFKTFWTKTKDYLKYSSCSKICYDSFNFALKHYVSLCYQLFSTNGILLDFNIDRVLNAIFDVIDYNHKYEANLIRLSNLQAFLNNQGQIYSFYDFASEIRAMIYVASISSDPNKFIDREFFKERENVLEKLSDLVYDEYYFQAIEMHSYDMNLLRLLNQTNYLIKPRNGSFYRNMFKTNDNSIFHELVYKLNIYTSKIKLRNTNIISNESLPIIKFNISEFNHISSIYKADLLKAASFIQTTSIKILYERKIIFLNMFNILDKVDLTLFQEFHYKIIKSYLHFLTDTDLEKMNNKPFENIINSAISIIETIEENENEINENYI